MKVLKQHPIVDYSKCIGCHSCERRCVSEAMRVLPLSGLEEKTAPCSIACPAHIDVCKYIGLISDGKFHEAYSVILQNNPFPSVCGRICTHPCEEKCSRAKKDTAVSIRDLKRFVADRACEDGFEFNAEPLPDNGKSVGIIGAGPSGLSCAYYLRLLGYEVHVYEEEAVAGGVLAYGIPEYRLPKAVLNREIDRILATGVNLHLNCSVGNDISFEELRKKHGAVYLATGTKFSRKMEVPGEDKIGVTHGLDFLRYVNTGVPYVLGKKVVVVGGGNTAIDVSRTAIRLGAEEVTIVYRRRRQDMPAEKIEILEAREEGVKIIELSAPVEVLGNETVEGIRCIKTHVVSTEKGRAKVEVVDDSEFTIECDTIIPAVSQYFDLPFLDAEAIALTKRGTLETGEETMMTSREGIFGGGDVSRGADIAINAIADGKKAAARIDQYLGGAGILNKGKNDSKSPKEQHVNDLYASKRPREKYIARDLRKGTMQESLLGYDEETAVKEARRCLRCESNYKAVSDWDVCVDCAFCVDFCPAGAVTLVDRDKEKPLPIEVKEEHREKVLEICRNAKLYPTKAVCQCFRITAAEMAEAIIEGNTTVMALIRRLGLLSGCGKYCATTASRMLEMNGYPQDKEMKYGKFYLDAYVAMRDLDPEYVRENFAPYSIDKELKYHYVEEALNKPEIWWPNQKG